MAAICYACHYPFAILLEQQAAESSIAMEEEPRSDVYVFGVILGIFIYKFIIAFFEKAMYLLFGLEALEPFDAIMMLDDDKSVANIMAVAFFEKFEYESMRQYIIEKSENVHKMRSKLVKRLGLFWFKKMGKEEWATKVDNFVTLKEGIHSKEDLIEFVLSEQPHREPLDTVQIRFILIPDYIDGKSAMVMKSHHVLADGLGFASMFLSMSDGDVSINDIPSLHIPFAKRLLIYLLTPFLFLKTLWIGATIKKDKNCIKNNLLLTGKKNAYYSEPLDIALIKSYCKANKCTINDYTFSLISNSLYEYMEKHSTAGGI